MNLTPDAQKCLNQPSESREPNFLQPGTAAFDEYPYKFRWGQAVRFTGGKYNGLQGTVRWVGPTQASILVDYQEANGKPTPFEVVEEQAFLTDLREWTEGKSATELSLKGGG